MRWWRSTKTIRFLPGGRQGRGEPLRRRGDLVIAETQHGLVCANAGVDRSNVAAGSVVTLPVDPDRSAHRIRVRLGAQRGEVGGGDHRHLWSGLEEGLVDVAIGVSGLASILDLRATDSYGRTLEVTEITIADEVAAAADLVMGKATGVPCAVVRGPRCGARHRKGSRPDQERRGRSLPLGGATAPLNHSTVLVIPSSKLVQGPSR